MRRRASLVAVAAILAATLAALVALPAAAAAAPTLVLGRRAVTFQSPPTGVAKAKWLSSSQGQFVDTNGNGLRDSLQGRGADFEDFGILRFREDWVRLQAHLDTNGNGIPDIWVTKIARETDVVDARARAYAVIKTPARRACFLTDALREYRVVHSVLFRRSVDNALGRRTLASNSFLARRLATDSDCTTTPPPPPSGPDLALAASHNPPSPLNGEAFTVVFAAGNDGTATANGVVFTVNLPDAWTGVTADVPGGTCTVGAGNVVTCQLNDLTAGEDNLISIHVGNANGADTFNLAGVLSSTTAGVANATVTETITVRPAADLSITKTFTDVADTTGAGIQELDDNFDYTLVVHNAGPNSASGVTVTDTWPAGLDNPMGTLPAGCTFNDPSPTTNTGETITCTIASLAPGAPADVTFVFHARTNGETSGNLSNTATVGSNTPDPVAGNNTATLTVPVA